MPYLLRWITVICLTFSILCPLIAVIPFGTYDHRGLDITYVEFWKRGGGLAFCATGAFFALLSYGFLGARPWVRFVFVIGASLLTIASIIRARAITFEAVACYLIFVHLGGWYLFRSLPVRRYFGLAPT